MSGKCILTVDDISQLLISVYRSEIGSAHGATSFFDSQQELSRQTLLKNAEGQRTIEQVAAMFGSSCDGEELTSCSVIAAAEMIFHSWNGVQVTFFTSGSTGKPQPVTHDFSLLHQEITALGDVFSKRKRVVGMVPAHHIYGFLFRILLPKVLEAEQIGLPPLPGKGFLSALKPGDLIAGFPLFWAGMARFDGLFPDGIHGVTSTGPCPPDAITEVLDKGLGRMTEVYGSSETGGIGTRAHEKRASEKVYTLLPYWKGSGDVLQRTTPDGSCSDYPVPDHVAWTGDRTFLPGKRRDKAVQVGGVNVYPERVRNILLEHPRVADCAVRLDQTAPGGRLKAFVVCEARRACPSAAELREWLKSKVTPQETPRSFTFGDTLPVSSMGKAMDWA